MAGSAASRATSGFRYHAADRRSKPSGSARNCSLASLITAPSGHPGDHLVPGDLAQVNATGYFAVNQPTVRDKGRRRRAQFLGPAVALDVDADRGVGAQELLERQPESDQQDVLHPSVERGGHLTEHRRVVSASSDTDSCPALA